MISVSETFKNLMISNIRPKCEPKIRIYGADTSGNMIELIWTAGNIKDLKYKIYTGRINLFPSISDTFKVTSYTFCMSSPVSICWGLPCAIHFPAFNATISSL